MRVPAAVPTSSAPTDGSLPNLPAARSRTRPDVVNQATFALYEFSTSAAPGQGPRLLGRFDDLRDALQSRDNAILDRLAEAGGRRVELTDLVVTLGPGGRCTTQLVACSVGQPVGWPVDLAAELAETASWLERLGRNR